MRSFLFFYLACCTVLFSVRASVVLAVETPVRLEVLSGPVFVDDPAEIRIAPAAGAGTLAEVRLAITAEGVTKQIPVRELGPGDFRAYFFPTALSEYRYDVSGVLGGVPFSFTALCDEEAEGMLPCPVAKDVYAVPYPQRTLNDILYARTGTDKEIIRVLQQKLSTSNVLSGIAVALGGLGFVVGFDAYRRVRVTKLDVLHEDLRL